MHLISEEIFPHVLLVLVKIVRSMAQRVQSGWGTQDTGLKAPSRPLGDQPELPVGLSDLPDHDLMELLSEFTSWTGYAGYVVAESTIAVRKANRVLQRIADGLTIVHKAKTVAETKARVAQDPAYIEAEDALDEAENSEILVKSLYTHLESCGKAVSRELTRRTSRANVEDRNGKYNT